MLRPHPLRISRSHVLLTPPPLRGGEPQLRTRRMVVSRSVYMVRHPRSSYIVYPLLSLEVATPENKPIYSTLLSICNKVRRTRGFASQAVLSIDRMQLALHATRPTPHGASRLVQARSAWTGKTRRAPSGHCSDEKVYGNTTTAAHKKNVHFSVWLSGPTPWLKFKIAIISTIAWLPLERQLVLRRVER